MSRALAILAVITVPVAAIVGSIAVCESVNTPRAAVTLGSIERAPTTMPTVNLLKESEAFGIIIPTWAESLETRQRGLVLKVWNELLKQIGFSRPSISWTALGGISKSTSIALIATLSARPPRSRLSTTEPLNRR